MGRFGKRSDRDGPGASGPGGEPEPAELWFTGGTGPDGQELGASASVQHGNDMQHGNGAGPGNDLQPGNGMRPRPRGPGGSGRTRWIALAAGFVVLVAVIAVQHAAGGRPAASDATSSSGVAHPSASATSTRIAASQTATTAATTASASAARSSEHPDSTDGIPPALATGGLGDPVPSSDSDGTPVEPDAGISRAPRTTTAPRQPDHLTGSWELVGYGTDGLVRYWPATGRLVVTPVPPLGGDGITALVATPSAAIVASSGALTGYVIPDGEPASPLVGLLDQSQIPGLIPGPTPDRLWATTYDGRTASLVPVDARGKPAGKAVALPSVLGAMYGYQILPDGAGYALVRGIGGTYDVRPGSTALVTHGVVLAAGPTAFLVYDCDAKARCATAVIDRATGKRRQGPALAPDGLIMIQGTISPNGRYAALLRLSDGGGPAVALIDLTTGAVRSALDLLEFSSNGDSSSMLAFTPDSRYLLVARQSGTVVPVDASTGKALAPLDLPPMSAIAVLPTP